METAEFSPNYIWQPGTGGRYGKRSLGPFYSQYSHRLLCYLLYGATYIIGGCVSIAIFYGPLWLWSNLAFAAAWALHAGFLYGGCYAAVDFWANRLGPETYQYQQRTVARQWLVIFISFLLAFTLHRSTYLLIIDLYAPWVPQYFQENPDLRRSLAFDFLYFSLWWAARTFVIIQFSLHHQKVKAPAPSQAQTREEPKTESKYKAEAPLLVYQANGESIEINHAEITHVSAEDHYCRIHHQAGQGVKHHLLRLTLKQLLEDLKGEEFFQVHRSHLVNLAHALGWKTEKHKRFLIMDHGVQLPISRSRMAELKPILKRLKLPRLN